MTSSVKTAAGFGVVAAAGTVFLDHVAHGTANTALTIGWILLLVMAAFILDRTSDRQRG